MNSCNNAKAGFILALLAAILWGSVPIAIQKVVITMTPYTLVWYRLAFSALFLTIILTIRQTLPSKQVIFHPKIIILLAIGIIGLGGNFIFGSYALKYLPPPVMQIVSQLSTVGLLFASVVVFKEVLRRTQIIGIIILISGILLFFNRGLIELFCNFDLYTLGVLFTVASALIWVSYGVAQKMLFKTVSAAQTLWILYIGSAVLFSFFAMPSEIANLNFIQLCWLGYCCINTVAGYGAFSEAMRQWKVAQVTSIIALTPLFTIIFSDLLSFLWPEIYKFERLNPLSYLGAFVVVSGSMCIAIGHVFLFKKRRISDIKERVD